MTKSMRWLLGLMVALSCTPALSQDASEPSVLSVFAKGDFVPHVPTVKMGKTQLRNDGQLQEVRQTDGVYYVYRVAQGGWLVLYAGEGDDDAFTAIEQVLYTDLPPAPRDADQPAGERLLGDTLAGIALGSDVNELKLMNIRLDTSSSTLFGVKVDTYEYVPFRGQDELRYRFFANGGRIVAFSVLVTE